MIKPDIQWTRPVIVAICAALLLTFTYVVRAAEPAPAADSAPADSTQAPAANMSEMEKLVGPIALYPDDLLSVVLPASTFPLQVVEADRWLKENKDNTEAKPKESWDDSVKALLSYPEVVSMMSADLEWTAAMGEAVVQDQTEVMDGVQSFRRKADGAGNLRSDEKQTVVVEEEVVKIVQADPEVIYVPQYVPQTVVVQQTVPVYPTYYPAPYPCYYYPYPPGHAFAAGVFWGATVAYAFDWWGGGIHNDVDIDIDRGDINIDRGDRERNVDRSNNSERATDINRSQSQEMSRKGDTGWKSSQNPSDVRAGRASVSPSDRTQIANRTAANTRAGGAPSGSRNASSRPTASTGTGSGIKSSRPTASSSNSSRYNNTSRQGSAARSSPPSRDAFSGMSSSRSASAYSSRGSMSRGSAGGGGRRR